MSPQAATQDQTIIVDPAQLQKPAAGKQAPSPSGTITVDPQELTAGVAPPQPTQPAIPASVPRMGAAPPQGTLDKFLAPIREGAIGHAVQDTMPRIAETFPRLFEPSQPIGPQAVAESKQQAGEIVPFEASVQKPGITKGVAEFAGGATTPENLLLMAGAPASRLLSAGFAASTIVQALKQSPELAKAVKDGDYATARQIATEIALSLAVAALAGHHALKSPKPAVAKAPAPVEEPVAPPAKPVPQLPVGTPPKLLPPGVNQGAGAELQSFEGPGEQPLVTPPPGTRIPPSGKAIEVGPTTIDPRELAKSNGQPKAPKAAKAEAAPAEEPTLQDKKVKLAELDKKYRDLDLQLRNVKSYERTRAITSKMRPLSEERKALRAEIEKVEPRPVAKPLSKAPGEDQPIGTRIAGEGLTHAQERPAEKPAEKVSKTPTYDKLPPEIKAATDAALTSHKTQPQSLQDATDVELKRHSAPGTPMKEQFARLIAHEAGMPLEKQSGAPGNAIDFLRAIGNKPVARPLTERVARGEERRAEEGQPPAGEAERRLQARRASVQQGASPLMRNAIVSEARKVVNDPTATAEEKRIAQERIDDIKAHPGEISEPVDINKVRAEQAEKRKAAGQPEATTRPMRTLADAVTTPEADRPRLEAKIAADESALALRNVSEANKAVLRDRIGEAKGRLAAMRESSTLPGMETAVREQAEAAAAHKGGELTKEFARPLSSIEEKAGQMETKSPLFRGTEASPQKEMFGKEPQKPKNDKESLLGKGSSMHFGVDPTMVSDLFERVNRAYQENIAGPAIEKAGLGRTHKDIEAVDPKLASRIRRYENAPLYFRTKAEDLVKQIVGNLTPEKERLFTLMADADSRENLQVNHPREFAQAVADKDIHAALDRYRPWEQALTKARTILGGATLDRDYLRRIYQEHIAGVGQKAAKGQGTPKANFDRIITPQKEGGPSRKATAEYHYQHGLHEFGPAFGTKFVGTMTKLAEHATAMDFLSKATKIEPRDEMPPFITYNGEKFYRPDVVKMIHEARPGEDSRAIARDLGVRELPKPKNVQAYEVYDPRAPIGGGPEQPKYIGPRSVVDALHGLDKSSPDKSGPVGRFLREQIIGVGFGVPHVMNIMRRISHSFPAGAGNPVNWVRAARVLTDRQLKERALSRTNDPTYDALLRWGGMSPHEIQSYKEYQGGNFNPANWLRLFAKVGHDYLFGPGGLDRRARLYVADLVKNERPDLTPEKVSQLVNDQLGRYNRATWTELQKRVGRYMLFPGWDFSSMNWVLRHPIRTAVPPAILMMLANGIINSYGGNRKEDRFDPFAIHVGHHSYGSSLMNESLARRLAAPVGAAAEAALQGGSRRQVFTAAGREVPFAVGAPFGMTMPQVRLPVEAGLGKDEFGRDIVPQGDWTRRGTFLPNKGLEDEAKHALVSFFPQGQRVEEGKQSIPEMGLANLGVQRREDQPRTKAPSERQSDVYNVKDDIRALEHQAAAIAEDGTLTPEEKQARLLPIRRKYQELIKQDRPR